MISFIGHRVLVTLDDGSTIEGFLRVYDKNGSLVVADAERTVTSRSGRQRRTTLLLVFLQGRSVVSLSCLPRLIGQRGVGDDAAAAGGASGTRIGADAARWLAGPASSK